MGDTTGTLVGGTVGCLVGNLIGFSVGERVGGFVITNGTGAEHEIKTTKDVRTSKRTVHWHAIRECRGTKTSKTYEGQK